jgi:hypothetical protein
MYLGIFKAFLLSHLGFSYNDTMLKHRTSACPISSLIAWSMSHYKMHVMFLRHFKIPKALG